MRRGLTIGIFVAAAAAASALVAVAACDIPLGAIRRSPPTGLDARIKSSGAPAADFTLDATTGRVALADVLAHGTALLVFYRGHW